MKPRPVEIVPLLTPGEVTRMLGVDPKTLSRWAKSGKFPEGTVIRTLGGHRRYREDVIRRLMARSES